MYRSSYIEVLDEAPQFTRANERAIILHSIWLLERAEEAGPKSREAIEALHFLRRLWEFLIIELGQSEKSATTETARRSHFSWHRIVKGGRGYGARRVVGLPLLKRDFPIHR